MSDALAMGPVVELEALYDALPTIACRGLCADNCTVIKCSPLESERMRQAAGRGLTFDARTGRCGYLTPTNRCAVYARRPLICRLFGMVRALRCEHGCQPTRVISALEALALVGRVDALSPGLVVSMPTGARGGRDIQQAMVEYLLEVLP